MWARRTRAGGWRYGPAPTSGDARPPTASPTTSPGDWAEPSGRPTRPVGFESEEAVPVDALPALAGALAEHGLLDVLQVRRLHGRADLSYAPRWHGLAIPVGMALGPDGVRRAGEERAVSGPLPGTLLGGWERRAVWYRVPDTHGTPRRAAELVSVQMAHLRAAIPG